MAITNDGIDITLPSSGDLSSSQYLFVKKATDGQAEVCGANDKLCIGILQNKPSAEGQEASVRVLGTSKLVVGEACAIGKQLTPTSAGKGEIVDAADEVATAQSLEAATADGDIISVLLRYAFATASDA